MGKSLCEGLAVTGSPHPLTRDRHDDGVLVVAVAVPTAGRGRGESITLIIGFSTGLFI